MKITEVVKLLKATLDIHGDIDVILEDADTNWGFKLEPNSFDFDSVNNRVVISVDYGDERV